MRATTATGLLRDSSEYLENYRRIVRLLGATFRGMGIEILLHDLVNPTHSITCIAGGEVTGRAEGMGTTKLVIDLKRRRLLNQDKLNYRLDIGARRFKCTTIPILREPHGIVGAICMNIDTNYIRDHVLASPAATEEFFRSYCATDMALDENILSRPEYELAYGWQALLARLVDGRSAATCRRRQGWSRFIGGASMEPVRTGAVVPTHVHPNPFILPLRRGLHAPSRRRRRRR